MAVNLASKYEKQFDAAFKPNSYLEGKCSSKYNFDGAKKINIYAPMTAALTNYERNGSSRYGIPEEMESTLQELELTQDKGFTKTLDRGNYSDSMMAISAGAWMQEQIAQVIVPTSEKYAFSQYIKYAGSIVTSSAAPTKSTIATSLMSLDTQLMNHNVPDSGRYLFIPASQHALLKLSDEFISIQNLGEKSVGKGIIGEFSGTPVVKLPDSYFPEDCYALLAHRDSILYPKKISTFKTHTNPPGIDGWLMEGRVYYDAFVLASKCWGVAALVLASKKSSVTLTTAGVASGTNTKEIWCTTDGTDPRYSKTKFVYSSAIGKAGDTIKAVGIGNEGYFTSDVVTETRAGG